MKSIIRNRYLTPEEIAKYKKIREQIATELPDLINRHHKKTMKAHISIDIHDVVKANGVKNAITNWCENSDTTSCGIIGPSFSTSGPGSGWTKNFSCNDYATRALQQGALHYIDVDDGKLISAEEVEYEHDKEYVIYNDGRFYQLGSWSDESVIEIVCPEITDAIEHPELTAEMAQSVIDYHYPLSNTKEWKELIDNIHNLAEAFENIDSTKLTLESTCA